MEPHRWNHEAGFGQTAVDTVKEMPTVVTQRLGSVLTMKTREVCRSCNNGWMSQLERQVKPLVLSLMDAAVRGWSIGILPDEAARLSTWAVKTAWMQALSAGTTVGHSDSYHYLRQRLLPPPDCKVWLGRHAGELDFNIKQMAVQVRRSDRPWDDGDIRNVLWTCLTFRSLSFLVYTVDGWGVPPPTRDSNRWRPVWPQSMSIRFPARFDVSDQDVLSAVALQAPALHTPDLPVFERDPDGTQYRRRN
ncbi:hypothetical protein ACFO0M_10980 [Micromonospora mangrovi]|uniref:Uncharacterized protein n=2 Tax=Micromonospora TaxID=1873 RepID=A0AAU7M5T0_9ACTN